MSYETTFDPSRVAEIISVNDVGDSFRGSGYALSNRVVLTAAHVATSGTARTVRIGAGTTIPWRETAATVLAVESTSDFALLLLETPIVGRPLAPVRLGLVEQSEVLIPCLSVGYPLFKLRPTSDANGSVLGVTRDSGQVDGRIATLSNSKTGTLEVLVTSPPRDRDDKKSPWEGMSGAALFVDNLLVGIITEHHAPEGPARLTASSISILQARLSDENWKLWSQQFYDDGLGVLTSAARSLGKAKDEVRVPASLSIGLRPAAANNYRPRAAEADLTYTEVGRVIVSGVSGAGKTQFAARFVSEGLANASLSLIIWITATDRTEVLRIYRNACVRLGLDISGLDTDEVAQLLLDWLGRRRRWCVVIDNLADNQLMRRLWPPDTGLTITTSWRKDLPQGPTGKVIELNVFDSSEAQDYVASRIQWFTSDEASLIASSLGNLPLALDQGCTFISAARLTSRQFLAVMSDRRMNLDEILPDGASLDGYERSLSASVSMATDLADRQSPRGAARRLLALASWLSPNSIPYSALVTKTSRDFVGDGLSETQVRQSLASLELFSLASSRANGIELVDLQIHSLVQRATRENDPALSESAFPVARDALLETWPSRTYLSSKSDIASAYRASAQALLLHLEALPDGSNAQSRLDLLYKVGESFDGGPNAAADHWTSLLSDFEAEWGEEHDRACDCRNRAAQALQAAGRTSSAVALLKKNVRYEEARVPRNDDNLATGQNNLASALESAGALDEAIPMYELALRSSEQVLGPLALKSLQTMSNLGNAYRNYGNPVRAVPILELALIAFQSTLGALDPDTLICQNNLAGALHDLGRLKPKVRMEVWMRALAMWETNLQLRRHIYATGDLRILKVEANLSSVLLDLGITESDKSRVKRSAIIVRSLIDRLQASEDRDEVFLSMMVTAEVRILTVLSRM